MAIEVDLAGLEAPGRQAEVSGNGARSLEACRVVDAGLERQCSNEADTGCRHQALADRIVVGHVAGSVIEFPEGVVQHQPGVQHRQQRVRQCLVGLDQRPDLGVEPAMPEALWQFDAEDLEEAPDLLLEIDALGQHRLAAGEQCSYLVTLNALDMYAAVSAAAQQLCDATRIILVGLVAHGRECRLHLPGLHADDLKASRLQAVGQVLGERAGLEADLRDLYLELTEESDDILYLRVRLAFGQQFSFVVDDAEMCRAQ